MATQATIDEAKLEAFLGQIVSDRGATFNAVLVTISTVHARWL